MTGVLKRAAIFDRLLDGVVDISATARKRARAWDRQFAKVCGWAERNGRLPGDEDDKRLYRWLDAQMGMYEIVELNVVQSKKIARLLNRFAGRDRGHSRKRRVALALGL